MKEFLTPSIIAALTSLVISIITLYQFFRNQNFQKEQLAKTQDREFTSKIYDLRLKHYPKVYEITDNVYREKGGILDPEKIKNIRLELIDWKKGIVSLILSVEARDSFFTLRDILLKNPANGTNYSEEQILKIIDATKNFRKQLRRDVGFLYREEKNRRSRL